METKKGMQRIADLGPVGDTVRQAITEERSRQNLTYAELSRRLDSAGRPISPLALRRIEAGARRVDVDDLTALAEVLAVSPLVLLGQEGTWRSDAKVLLANLPPASRVGIESTMVEILHRLDRLEGRKDDPGYEEGVASGGDD